MTETNTSTIHVMDQWLMHKLDCTRANLPAAVQRLQLENLQAQLAYAALHSRFYRERLVNISVAGLNELHRLPFMDAADMLPWENLLCVRQGEIERLVTLDTSGSSGPPKRLAFSRNDLESTMDFFRAGMSQLVLPGETLLVLLPGAQRPFGVADLLRRALEQDHIRVEAGTSATTPETLACDLARVSPQAIVAAPRQWCHLAALPASLYPHLRGVLSSAEPLPPHVPPLPFLLLDHYGLTESAYGGGVECPCHRGYHMRELDLLVEIVDVDTGMPLPDGQTGEVVLTTLTRQAMPLIRYRTGDAACMLPGPCGCGSPLRRLSRVEGRILRQGSGFTIRPVPKGEFVARTAPKNL